MVKMNLEYNFSQWTDRRNLMLNEEAFIEILKFVWGFKQFQVKQK